ncbi:MAG: lysophospholipase L1-like esterase [Paraglaciecola sp.]|jgi:lysophospholipase L1-like esterase
MANNTSPMPYDICMIGSSIFEFWGSPQWGQLLISNQAIRSTTTEFWLDHDLSLLPTVNHILVYCGSNDLIFGNNSQQIIVDLHTLITRLSVQFPKSQIGYFSILQCPQKQAARQLLLIEQINTHMRHQAGKQYHYFEFNEALRNQAKWFADDGLHLTPEAYEMLNKFYQPVMERWIGN